MSSLKIFAFIPLMEGWSRVDWLAHYADRHGPLVARTTAFRRHFLRYDQNYVEEPASGDHGAIVAVSELWLRDAAALDAAFAEPAYLGEIRADEQRFTDASRIRGGIAEEVVIAPGAGRRAAHKLFVSRTLEPDVDPAEARNGWSEAARRSLAPLAAAMGIRYIQTYPIEPGGWPGFDMVDIFEAEEGDVISRLRDALDRERPPPWFSAAVALAARSRSIFGG